MRNPRRRTFWYCLDRSSDMRLANILYLTGPSRTEGHHGLEQRTALAIGTGGEMWPRRSNGTESQVARKCRRLHGCWFAIAASAPER